MQITRGVVGGALKIGVYGVEGIGKSSFGAQMPEPLFIDTEGSTRHMDVARLPDPSSWPMLMSQLDFVYKNRPCKTLVIDTADWAEKLAREYIINTNKVKSIEDIGYGKGYVMVAEEWGRMLNRLSDIVDSGINVVITAHAMMRKFEQPDEMGAYDRWELKLDKRTASLTKEWADLLLFANYKTTVITDAKTKAKKGVGGDRVMYTSHHPAWDAKNRFWLDDELPFLFESIAHLLPTGEVKSTIANVVTEVIQETIKPLETPFVAAPIAEPVEQVKSPDPQIPKALADLMKSYGVQEQHIQEAIFRRGYFPKDTPVAKLPAEFVNGVLIGAWKQILDYMISENIVNTNDVPF